MYRKVKGFQDIYGLDCVYWEKVESAVKKAFKLFNTEEIRIPILEQTAIFDRGIGGSTDIVEKEMFTFQDRDGESLSLRPELTAGVIRAYIENGLYSPPSLKKFCYLGPAFRRERPQKGRFRQFTQAGAEYIGSGSPITDADVINLFYTIFKNNGLDEYAHIEINSVGCPECRPDYNKKLIEYFTGHIQEMCDDCKRRLHTNPLRIIDCKNEKCRVIIKDAPLMIDNLCHECKDHFDQVQVYLTDLKIPYRINPFMVRGLDYYVRTAFEMVTDRLGAASAIGGGGRYDGLSETLGGPKSPGIGFAVGMDRIVALIKEVEKIPLTVNKADVYLITFGGATLKQALNILSDLREKDVVVEIDYEQKGLKNQMKKADRSGALFSVIIGEDELSKGEILIRNMKKSEQFSVRIEDTVSKLLDCLKESDNF